MIKTILFSLTLVLVSSIVLTSSAETNPDEKQALESNKWITQKQKLIERAICDTLEFEVEHPKNPAHYSDYQLSYKVVAEDSKKFVAPLMIATTNIPYKEKDSLQNMPTPSIESLSCRKTVEVWRAMYEYKTIPYKESKWKPLEDLVHDTFSWIKKTLLVFVLVISTVIASAFMFYNTIKLTNGKNKSYKLLGFVCVTFFPISPIAIAPFYFIWTVVLGNAASLISYLIGCIIFVAVMTLVFLIRKKSDA